MPNANSSISESTTRRDAAATASAARHRLRASSYRALDDVRCDFVNGVMVLRGRLPSFYLKQLAQEVVRDGDNEWTIMNEVEVDDSLPQKHQRIDNGEWHTSASLSGIPPHH